MLLQRLATGSGHLHEYNWELGKKKIHRSYVRGPITLQLANLEQLYYVFILTCSCDDDEWMPFGRLDYGADTYKCTCVLVLQACGRTVRSNSYSPVLIPEAPRQRGCIVFLDSENEGIFTRISISVW